MTVSELIERLRAMPDYREIGISDCNSPDHDCDGFCDLLEIVDVIDSGFSVEIISQR